MATPLQTTALYRRLGRRTRLPTVYPTRPSYLQRLMSMFSL